MKLARSKNAIRIMRISLLNHVVTILGPFAVRTVFIHTLSADYLGLNSLFGSILSVLSLTELGFGTAVVFNMYQAIAQDDTYGIDALLFFYRRIYRIIGLIIFTIGLLLIPFLPRLVHNSYPKDINIYVVYLIFLFNSVCSYFLYAYLGSLLNAFQRTDVSTRISMLFNVVQYTLQIVLLLTFHNYYVFISILPIFTLLGNYRTAILAKKLFPQYRPQGQLSPAQKASIKEKVSGLMIDRVCQISRNAFDSIFVSAFLGLVSTAQYNNYYYILTSVMGLLNMTTGGILSGAGNSVATESKEKNYRDMMRLNFAYMWLAGWCTVCLFCLYQQFIKIWAGEAFVLPFGSMFLLCIYFYVLCMGNIRAIYVSASGIWWHNRFRALLEAAVNILLNYFLGKYFGINGIIIATLISLFFINFCYGSTIIYRHYFTEQKMSDYFSFHGVCAAVTASICIFTFYICSHIPETSLGFSAKMIVCAFVPNVLYYLIYRRTKQYREAIPWLLVRFGVKKNCCLYKLLVPTSPSR